MTAGSVRNSFAGVPAAEVAQRFLRSFGAADPEKLPLFYQSRGFFLNLMVLDKSELCTITTSRKVLDCEGPRLRLNTSSLSSIRVAVTSIGNLQLTLAGEADSKEGPRQFVRNIFLKERGRMGNTVGISIVRDFFTIMQPIDTLKAPDMAHTEASEGRKPENLENPQARTDTAAVSPQAAASNDHIENIMAPMKHNISPCCDANDCQLDLDSGKRPADGVRGFDSPCEEAEVGRDQPKAAALTADEGPKAAAFIKSSHSPPSTPPTPAAQPQGPLQPSRESSAESTHPAPAPAPEQRKAQRRAAKAQRKLQALQPSGEAVSVVKTGLDTESSSQASKAGSLQQKLGTEAEIRTNPPQNDGISGQLKPTSQAPISMPADLPAARKPHITASGPANSVGKTTAAAGSAIATHGPPNDATQTEDDVASSARPRLSRGRAAPARKATEEQQPVPNLNTDFPALGAPSSCDNSRQQAASAPAPTKAPVRPSADARKLLVHSLPRLSADALLLSLRQAFHKFGFLSASLLNINSSTKRQTTLQAVVIVKNGMCQQEALSACIVVSGKKVLITKKGNRHTRAQAQRQN